MAQGVPFVAQQLKNWLGSMRTQFSSLALPSELRIWCSHELWCRLQTWFGSCVAVAVALIGPLSWESPYAVGAALKKKKKKMWYIYTVEYYLAIKEKTNTIWYHLYVESKIILYTKHTYRGHGDQTCGFNQGNGRERDGVGKCKLLLWDG